MDETPKGSGVIAGMGESPVSPGQKGAAMQKPNKSNEFPVVTLTFALRLTESGALYGTYMQRAEVVQQGGNDPIGG